MLLDKVSKRSDTALKEEISASVVQSTEEIEILNKVPFGPHFTYVVYDQKNELCMTSFSNRYVFSSDARLASFFCSIYIVRNSLTHKLIFYNCLRAAFQVGVAFQVN